jgi:hypothetical protein
MEHVPQFVPENIAPLMTTVHQVNTVVIVIKVPSANVLDLVLENRVNMIPTADQVNIVVDLMEHVP